MLSDKDFPGDTVTPSPMLMPSAVDAGTARTLAMISETVTVSDTDPLRIFWMTWASETVIDSEMERENGSGFNAIVSMPFTLFAVSVLVVAA